MVAVTSPYLWYLSRATGVVSLCLLTAVMALGVGTATRAGGRVLLRFEVAELHRRLSLLAVVFVGVHVTATVLDTYVATGWLAAVVPGASPYKTFPVALGALAVDCLLAVIVTSLLRGRISPSAWRAVHWLSYLCWPIAVLHVVQVGTDMRSRWMLALVVACVGIVAVAVLRRAAWRHRAVPEGARTVLHPHPRGASAAPRTPVGPRSPRPTDRDVRRVASTRRPR